MSKILGILKRRQISGVTKLFILFPMFSKRSTLAPMSCPCGEILEKRWLCSRQKATSTWRFIFFEISWQNLYLSTFPGSGTNGEEFEVALPNDRSAGKRISITISSRFSHCLNQEDHQKKAVLGIFGEEREVGMNEGPSQFYILFFKYWQLIISGE